MFAHGRFNSLLKALTGTRRRGTILLLVLGALAMVLILTVVYAALGKGDRQTGRSVNLNRDATEVVDDFGVYVSGIIAGDVFDVVPEFAEQRLLEIANPTVPFNELAGRAVYRLEGIDAPISDFSKRSVVSLLDIRGITDEERELVRFNPTGAHTTRSLWPSGAAGSIGGLAGAYPTDPRIAADPWLSSLRPSDLGLGSKSNELVGGDYINAPFYARALDWTQITNIAPDGRFVNLAFLRGNFGAPSLDLTRDPDSLDSRLTLFSAAGDAVAFGDGGYSLGFADVEDYGGFLVDDGNASEPDWNIPAHWTMYQRNMARTIAELSREGFNTDEPDEPTYWEYSYADADGDGIIDSRWFELVDASTGFEVPLLGERDRRYFAAARIIDLSGLINVNTATDTISPPTLDNRGGQGPHEVSLFTLLTLDMHSQAVTGIGDEIAYADVFEGEGADDYSDFDGEQAVRAGRKSFLRLRESILDWAALEFGEVPTEQNDNADWSTDLRDYTPYVFTAEGPDAKREDFGLYGSVVPGFAGGGTARTGPFGLTDLIELLTFHGANDPEVFTALEKAFITEIDDTDLATRSLLRSDRSLLREIGVEIDGLSNQGQPTDGEINRRARAQLDIRSLLTTISGSRPIRSVTTDAAGLFALDEADRRYRVDELMLGNPGYEGNAGDPAEDIVAAQNQARNPLIENGFKVYLETLAPHFAEFTGSAAWPASSGTSPFDNTRTLFYGHNGPEIALRIAAHMAVNFRDAADRPFVDMDNDGVPDPGTLLGVESNGTTREIVIEDEDGSTTNVPYGERRDEPSRALVYAVQESERDAAMTDVLVTLLDADGDGNLDESDVAILDADVALGIEPGETVLASTRSSSSGTIGPGGQPQSSDAFIVYGVEAQPFISEVFYFNAYWDAPRANPTTIPPLAFPWFTSAGAGPDSDLLSENPDTGEYSVGRLVELSELQTDTDAVRGTVSIDGAVEEDNRDFLFQIVVFQLFNPFDVPVSLRDFYLEFGDSIFRPRPLPGTEESYMLQPGDTRLLFATNPTLALADPSNQNDISGSAGTVYAPIAERIQSRVAQAALLNSEFTATTFSSTLPTVVALDIIENLVPDPDRIPLHRYDVEGSTLEPAFKDLLAGDSSAYGANDPRNRTALLWWDLGDRFDTSNAPAWRRDDLLADRITDPTPVTDPPALDQRLNLGSVAFAGGPLDRPEGIVNDAITGAGFDIDAPPAVAFSERFEPVMANNPMNLNRQRSVGLWSRIRRFDVTADDTGAGGRRANDLPNPNGIVATDPVTAPAGINPTDGDRAVQGVPSGALPAAALETDENVIVTADDLTNVGGPTGFPVQRDFLEWNDSFPVLGVGIIAGSFETARTIEEFVEEQLRNPDRFRELRQQSLLLDTTDNGVLSPERYEFLVGPGGPVATYLEYADISTVSGRGGVPYSGDRMIQITQNSREFRSTIDGFPQLRVGDLLNVLAVGPYRMPLRGAAGSADGYPAPGSAVRTNAYLNQWTTLGEILGLTEGVLPTLEPGSGVDEFDKLAGALDRGHLRLDEFVPYFDADGDPATPFDPALDRRRGLGIPVALNIFDIAQAGGELPERAYGGIDSPIAGLVNINTAPPSVLRTLPGLYQDAPDFGRTRLQESPSWPAWRGRLETEARNEFVGHANVLFPGSADPTVQSGAGGEVYDRLDIASSILSYREPAAGYRFLEGRGGVQGPGGGGPALDRPLNMVPLAARNATGQPDLARGVEILRVADFDGDGNLDDGQGPSIEGLRTTPSFASLGELLAVRSSGAPGTGAEADRFQFGMDWVARDRRTMGQLFLDPDTDNPPVDGGVDFTDPQQVHDFIVNNDLRIVSLDPGLLGDPLRFVPDADDGFQLPTADQIPDDYDEQLVQINLLANSVSTSSDFYAAWIVIHGFDEDDVADLDDNEPMRPSFQRRYLMVVDRSNVVRRGDSPRVLAFLELPYDEQVRRPIYAAE